MENRYLSTSPLNQQVPLCKGTIAWDNGCGRCINCQCEIAAMAGYRTGIDASDFPLGAIENGRSFIDRLENIYDFRCEAGGLAMSADWRELKRCFEHMAEYLTLNRSKLDA